MRILHVITQLDKMYGAQRHVVESVRNHLTKRHDCLVISGEIGIASTAIEEIGVEVKHLHYLKNSYNIINDIQAILQLTKIIANYQPDIVISHSSKAGIITRITCYLKKVPNIFTVHGWSFEIGTPWYQQFFGRISERVLKHISDSYFCVSKYTANYGIKVLQLNKQSVYVCPNMHKPKQDVITIFKEYNNVLMVACFRRQKDHVTALKALHHIINVIDINNIHITFAGDGPQRGLIENYIDKLGLQKNVTLLGEVANIDACYNTCDMVILPTYYEGLPMSLIEAIQKNKPIIATNVGGISEIIDDTVNGNLIAVGDYKHLANLIVSYYQQHKLASLGIKSGKIYEDLYSYEKISFHMNSVIHQSLQQSIFRK